MVTLVLDGLVGSGRLVSHFLLFVSQFFSFFPKQFTVRGSQCFKEWSPWCWMVWSGSRPACLPLPFICLPVLFFCLPVLFICRACGRVPGRLVSHFLSFVSHFFSGCGRVPGRLVSHFLLIVSHFFSFVSQAGCLCLPLPFICLPVLFICLPGWVLVVGFPAGLSPTSFHLSPTLSPSSFHLSLRLGAFVSHFLECVLRFFSFVSQAGCLWSGSRLACLALPCICLPFPFMRLVSHFLAFVSHFFPKQFTVRGVIKSFLRRVRPLCHCWCPPISTGHVLLVRPFPLAMQHFYS